jgi:hypothetical protein
MQYLDDAKLSSQEDGDEWEQAREELNGKDV